MRKLADIEKELYSIKPIYLTVYQLARVCNVSYKQVKRWLKKGLKKYIINKGPKGKETYLIRIKDLEDFLKRREKILTKREIFCYLIRNLKGGGNE